MTSPRRRRSRGMSTMEVLVGSTVSMIALAGTYSAFVAQSRAFTAQSTYSQSQNVTRTVIDLMTREIRMAAYDPSGAAMPVSTTSCPGVKQGILEATPSRLSFRQDLNGDGDVADTAETVTYELLYGEIRRTDGNGTPVTLATGVADDGLVFRYYDISHNELSGGDSGLTQSQRNCVAKLMMTVRAEAGSTSNGASYASVAESEIAIRNLSLINF